MRLSPPKKGMYNITLILGIVGIVLYIVSFFVLPFLAIVGFASLAIAFILLIISLSVKGI
jgi:hypothetical protein